jgi:LysM repeat protein
VNFNRYYLIYQKRIHAGRSGGRPKTRSMKMKTKRILLTLAIILLIIGLTACERPASQPPTGETSPTEASEFPVPGATDDVMNQLESFATQTAIAMQGGTEGLPEAPTPTPGEVAVDATPVAEATPEPTVAPQVEAPTAAPAAAITTPEIPGSYTLQKGEHPYCIARRFDVNPDEMLRLSGLARSNSYTPGTVLKIPQTGNEFPADRSLRNHPTTYTVSSGETIYSIACLFGDVFPISIAEANGLASPYKLTSGQELKIP